MFRDIEAAYERYCRQCEKEDRQPEDYDIFFDNYIGERMEQ
jgi:hypothetical protein